MMLSKEVAVYLNLAACKLKQYSSSMLRRHNVGLTPEQFLLIDQIWNQGPMSQQKIADIMQKDKNSITKLVDGLERKKMIRRLKDSSDRRSNSIVLTELGEAMKNEYKEKGVSLLDDILCDIPEEELKNFLDTLKKIISNMSR